MWWITNDVLSHMLSFQIQCRAITEQFASVAHLPRMWRLWGRLCQFLNPTNSMSEAKWRKKDLRLSQRALTWSPYSQWRCMDGWAWQWCHEYWSYLGWYEARWPQPWRRWVLWDDWTMPWEHVKVVSPFNHFIKMFQLIWSLENDALTPEPAMIKSIDWTWLLIARWKEWPMLIYIGILLLETQDYPMIILFHHCENFRMNTLWRCLTCSVYSIWILIFFFLTDFKPFPAFGKRTVSLWKGDPSVPAAFLREGLVPCSPHLPTVAITIRVLELYRNASLWCPHLAINSFVKALSDLHGIPFRPYLRKQFSICFDVYMSIQNRVDLCIQTALKRDDPGWRLRHACPACTYKLTGEAELEFSMLITMDGNDSLKRVQRREECGCRLLHDTRASGSLELGYCTRMDKRAREGCCEPLRVVH